MDSQNPSAPAPSDGAPKASRKSTNNDANLLANSLKRLSLHTAANTPLPQSPSLNSPRQTSEPLRLPSSPGVSPAFPPSLRRSSSVASLNRSSSPALGRKSSSSSLRDDMVGRRSRPATPRRASVNPNLPAASAPKSPLASQPEEKPPLTAFDVAEGYFQKELGIHEDTVSQATAGTHVFIHDQCYGHRYSRPGTSQEVFDTYFERPERILAAVLGISSAYVRLGDRHCDGANPPHPEQVPPDSIPFKIRKSSRFVNLTSRMVTNVHGMNLMRELKFLCTDAERRLAETGAELAREKGQAKFSSTDLYLCPESLNALQGALGGVQDAVDTVFQGTSTGMGPSRAFVCIRPPGHHCSKDWPSGFCWINNVHVGIEHAVMKYGLTHAAIIDFDLHHGDGSQAITMARNKKAFDAMQRNERAGPSIGYFSLHDINSFPCESGDVEKTQAASVCIDSVFGSAYSHSVWNVHLQPWRTMREFWDIYEKKYMILIEKARQYLEYHTNRLQKSPDGSGPKSAIFISAGFDASQWETEGMQRHGCNVPTEFYARFTQDIVRLAEEVSTGADGRVISVLEGGYSNRALTSGVLSHLCGLTTGQVGSDSSSQTGLATGNASYDPHWWNDSTLSELEKPVNPPTLRPKKAGPPPTYSSPTQSFTAKVVDPTKIRRSASSKFMSSPSRASTPPPPAVDWAIASQALSKLLTPRDRETRSRDPAELSKPIKKVRQAPALSTGPVNESGRQTRSSNNPLKSVAEPDIEDKEEVTRAESRASRRRTIADFPLASEEPVAAARPASRRMSIASIGSVNGDRPLSRASSIMPGRRSVAPAPNATTNGVQVKKARGTAAPRALKNQSAIPRASVDKVNKINDSGMKEKENELDQLTSRVQRITLRMPARDENDAPETKKGVEAKKNAAAPKGTTRKTPAPRTTKTTKTATAMAAKKGSGRPAKTSKPPSPVEPIPENPIVPTPALPCVAAATSPEPPKLESTAAAPLEQPQPVQPESKSSMLPSLGIDRRTSELIEPPTELKEINITPDQLPNPRSMSVVDPLLPMATSPPRPDTPPPPPPPTMPEFANTFGSAASIQGNMKPETQVPLHWMTPNADVKPMMPGNKRQDLPVFSASGTIPFAPNPNTANTAVQPNQSETAIKKEKEDIWDVPQTPAR